LKEGKMTINGEQVKVARMLLNWTQDKLAGEAGLSTATIRNFGIGRKQPSSPIVSAIRLVLESAGVEFADD
jgi:DNA-binding transcriptional regulator YiaG